MQTSFRAKIGLIFFGSFLFLILLEIALRAAGLFHLHSVRGGNNEVHSNDNSQYRILALGESTTGWRKNGWPNQLEKKLTSAYPKAKFKVYNEGIPASNTANILNSLDENLQKYKPHLVITMMGINDFDLSYKFDEKEELGFLQLLNSLRVVKLLHWLWSSDVAKNTGFSEKKQSGYMSKPLKEMNSLVDQAKMHDKNGNLDLAEKYYREYLKSWPDNPMILNRLVKTFLRQGRSREYIRKYLKNAGLSLSAAEDRYKWDITQYHYKKLYEKLKQENIAYIAMQYPTMPVNLIESIFEGESGVVFISNEENFKEALSRYDREEIFTDRFAATRPAPYGGELGHLTLLGEKLIAKKVFEYLDSAKPWLNKAAEQPVPQKAAPKRKLD